MRLLTAILLLFHPILSDIHYKFGSRSEVVTTTPDSDVSYSRFPNGLFSKTYDQRLYQYPMEDTDEEIKVNIPKPNKDLMQAVQFDKSVTTERGGLHRAITYSLTLSVPEFEIRLANGVCKLAIIDYCDFGFYIDYEEIEQGQGFRFIENERMDIERMDAVARQYSYVLEFSLNQTSFQRIMIGGKYFRRLNLSLVLPYHLRYGEANRAGRTLYRIMQGFDIATDCWHDEGEKPWLKDLRRIPRFDWALNKTFGPNSTGFVFVELDADRRVQNFELPVGNTEWTFWVQVSTKVLICYGVAVTLFAIFVDYKDKKKGKLE